MSSKILDKSKASTFKIVIIGDSCAGKSSLLLKLTENRFIENHRVTIGVDFRSKNIEIDEKVVRLKVWDTAGQERFRSIIRTYYNGTHGIILLFDLTNEESFNNLGDWIKEINETGSEKVCVILVGNKSDLKDQIVVYKEDVDDFIKNCGVKMKYFECSSKTGENVAEAFNELTTQLLSTEFPDSELEKIKMPHDIFDLYMEQKNNTQITTTDYTGCCIIN